LFGYDDLGRMVQAEDRSPELDPIIGTFRYDTGGRLLEEDQKLPLRGRA